MKIGIKIIWSGCLLLPKAKNIINDGYSIGYSNKFNNYTYRFYPYIKLVKNNK